MDWAEISSSELSSNAAVFVPSSSSVAETSPSPSPAPEPETPQSENVSAPLGFMRLSRRVFVTAKDISLASMIDELNKSHALGVSEKNMIRLDKDAWGEEEGTSRDEAFAAAVIRAFRVKGGKPGSKFWKGVREAVMKQCGTQDLVLLISDSQCDLTTAGGKIATEQVNVLLKNVFEAADTKAAADQMVGLKSGKLLAVLQGWPSNEVRVWAVVADDPVPTQTQANAWARRHEADDLSQYYASRQPPPRQVPPRQRQQFLPPPPGRPYPMAHGMGAQSNQPFAPPPASHYIPRAALRQQVIAGGQGYQGEMLYADTALSRGGGVGPPGTQNHYATLPNQPQISMACAGTFPGHMAGQMSHQQMLLNQQQPQQQQMAQQHAHSHAAGAHNGMGLPMRDGMGATVGPNCGGMGGMGCAAGMGGVGAGHLRWQGSSQQHAPMTNGSHVGHSCASPGFDANGSSFWGWEEQQANQTGGSAYGQSTVSAIPSSSRSLSMREANERAAAVELLWAGQMGGAGADPESSSRVRSSSRADTVNSGMNPGISSAMSSGINPNARSFTPSGLQGIQVAQPQHPSVGGGGAGGVPGNHLLSEDLSLRAAADSLWGQTASSHVPPVDSQISRATSVSSCGPDQSHGGHCTSVGVDQSYGEVPTAVMGSYGGMGPYGNDRFGGASHSNGMHGCLPSNLGGMFGASAASQLVDSDTMGASSLLASLGISESEGSYPGLPGMPLS